jgi:hypothetical protein
MADHVVSVIETKSARDPDVEDAYMSACTSTDPVQAMKSLHAQFQDIGVTARQIERAKGKARGYGLTIPRVDNPVVQADPVETICIDPRSMKHVMKVTVESAHPCIQEFPKLRAAANGLTNWTYGGAMNYGVHGVKGSPSVLICDLKKNVVVMIPSVFKSIPAAYHGWGRPDDISYNDLETFRAIRQLYKDIGNVVAHFNSRSKGCEAKIEFFD